MTQKTTENTIPSIVGSADEPEKEKRSAYRVTDIDDPNQIFRATMDMVYQVKRTSAMKSKISRNFGGYFTDRIPVAASEPTLLSMMERLAKLLDSDMERIYSDVAAQFIAVSSVHSADSVLSFIRAQPRIVAMIAMSRSFEDYEDAMAGIRIDLVKNPGEVDLSGVRYDIPILATTISPLAHGGDEKAGNITRFRRCRVMTSTGATIETPFYSGNALRGQMRDLLADHLLESLGLKADRKKPSVALWFFHAIYAGGTLGESGGGSLEKEDPAEEKPKKGKVKKEKENTIETATGKAGVIRADGVRDFRNWLPALSLLGVAAGNKIFCGRVRVGDLKPCCVELGTGIPRLAELTEYVFLTRRDDYEGRTEEDKNTSMIAQTEAIKAGVFLHGGIDIDGHVTDLERSALGLGLELMVQKGYIGAESRRGFGKVDFDIHNIPDSSPYLKFLEEEKDGILGYLNSIGALVVDLKNIPAGEDVEY